MTNGSLLAPSGKSTATENFPVGSFLIERRLRPYVAAYYAWARAIDDIADDPQLDPEEKLKRLDLMELTLAGAMGRNVPGVEVAWDLRDRLLETDIPFSTALDLVSAFKQDVEKNRYANWAELMDYCNRSAAPVGRFLLHLHGERDPAAFEASDALCNALQVINHLQDCKEDYLQLDRVYIPQDWITEAGANDAMLAAHASTGEMGLVIDRCINATRDLMEAARHLPALLENRRLAMEAAVIVEIADALLFELFGHDPIRQKVRLSKMQYAGCFIRGIRKALTGGYR